MTPIPSWHRQFVTRHPQDPLPRALTVHANGTDRPGWRLDGIRRRDAGYRTLKICLGGAGWLAVDGRRRTITPGAAMLFRSNDPAVSHGFDGRGASHWRWLRCSWQGADDQAAALEALGGHLVPLGPRHPLVRRLEGWRCAGRAETVLDAAASASLVYAVLAAIADRLAAEEPPVDATALLCAAARERAAAPGARRRPPGDDRRTDQGHRRHRRLRPERPLRSRLPRPFRRRPQHLPAAGRGGRVSTGPAIVPGRLRRRR